MRIPFSSVITLFLISTLGLSCYEEKGFSFDPANAFTWFECPLIINSHPKLFLSQGSLDQDGQVIRLANPFATVIIEDRTEGKSYQLKSTEKYHFITDSLEIKANHTYHLYINSNGRIYQDSAHTFSTDAKFKIGIKEVDPLNNVVEGFIDSVNEGDIRFIYADHVLDFSYLYGDDFVELFPHTNFRLRYLCGRPVQNTKINYSIHYTSSETYNKLNKIRNSRKEFHGISALYPPTNYDDNMIKNKFGGFFGFVGILHSNTLENLDNSEKVKTLRLIDAANQTDVTEMATDIYTYIIGDLDLNGNSTSPSRSREIRSFLQISMNELNSVYLRYSGNPYKCQTLPEMDGWQWGVRIICRIDGKQYIGFAKFKDLYAKEQIDILLK